MPPMVADCGSGGAGGGNCPLAGGEGARAPPGAPPRLLPAAPAEPGVGGAGRSAASPGSRSDGAMASPATSERIDSRSAESFAKLSALRRRGEELPRIEPLAAEGRPHFRHGGQIAVVEHQAHVVALLPAHAGPAA